MRCCSVPSAARNGTHVGFDRRPELAILTLRRELGLFANLRPAVVLDPLVDASTLKPDVVRGLDIMIVRETVGRGSISASRAASRPCPTAAGGASTPRSTARTRSSA